MATYAGTCSPDSVLAYGHCGWKCIWPMASAAQRAGKPRGTHIRKDTETDVRTDNVET